ncbi:MAG: DUF3105 domain-containing protein [bacterium]|nr:DUF3105 domain-containing protein [bacterium]
MILIVTLIIFAASRPRPGEVIPSQGNRHIESVNAPHEDYNSYPPTSGPHTGAIARWGVYTTQIPDEMQVHNLEDGGVIIHYREDKVDDSTINALTEIVERYHEGVILEPYANMETAIAVTAWGRIDRMEELDTARVLSFIKSYQGIDHHAR